MTTRFLYTIYIATTVEKAWQALVEGDLTRQYWGHVNVSDWIVGSPWEHRRADAPGEIVLLGEVLECAPPHRLVVTWAPPAVTERSRVTFALDTVGKMVRLTVTHDQLAPGSAMERDIGEGWPRVLSSLKSFLETGTPLDTWAEHRHTGA